MKKRGCWYVAMALLLCGCNPVLYLPGRVNEGEGTLNESGYLQLPWAVPGAVITLESSDPRLVVPRLIETDKKTLIAFSIKILGNSVEDAENTALVRAWVPGFSVIETEVEITDDEDPAYVPTEAP